MSGNVASSAGRERGVSSLPLRSQSLADGLFLLLHLFGRQDFVRPSPTSIGDFVDQDHREGTYVFSKVFGEDVGGLVDDLFFLLGIERTLGKFVVGEGLSVLLVDSCKW